MTPPAVTGTRFRRFRLVAAAVLAVAGATLAGVAVQAQLAPRDARLAPLYSARSLASPAIAPVFPTGPAAGMCQCISDRTRRNIHCLGGAAACQSVCGTTNYSMVPNAAFTCPLAPGEQLTQ